MKVSKDPPRKLAKEVFVNFIPGKDKHGFAKEWRKVLAKDHVIRTKSQRVFNTAHLLFLKGPRFFIHYSLRISVLAGSNMYTYPAERLHYKTEFGMDIPLMLSDVAQFSKGFTECQNGLNILGY